MKTITKEELYEKYKRDEVIVLDKNSDDYFNNFLEVRIKSHPDNYVENNDRLVWMSDVKKEVKEFFNIIKQVQS